MKAKEKGRIQAKRRRKRRSVICSGIFYGFLILSVVAVFAVTAWGVRALTAAMTVYEAAQPKYAAEAAARPYLERDWATLSRCVDPNVFRSETREQYAEYMNGLTAGRAITYAEASSTDENVKRYIVKADDMKMGEFTLRHDGEDPQFHNWLWKADTMSMEPLQPSVFTVSAPETSSVYVDGRVLGPESVKERGIPEFETMPLPEGASVPTRCVYEFKRYFSPGSVRVVDRYGEETALTDEGGGRYTAAFTYDDSRMAAELDERVIQVVRRLSCFMTNDWSLRQLSKDLVDGSNALKYVQGYDGMWIMEHKSYEFTDMNVSHYVSYAPDCFSVETRYTYTIRYIHLSPDVYPTAYRLYFKKQGDTWRLFDFEVI